MDYEKLHKDTINRLQQMVSCGKIPVETACGICADFVPESEDERIRRSLSAFFAKFKPNDMWDDDFSFGDIVAWFEKKGQTFTKKDVDDAYLKGVCDTKQELEKQVIPIFNIGDRVRYKGHKCDGVITEITDTDYICGDAKLPISTQDKLELVAWSEEDESMCTKTIFALAGFMGNEDKIDWLKSLKDRYTWKPTGEQMGIIAQSVAVLKVSGHDELGDRLGDISEQLNKLKG